MGEDGRDGSAAGVRRFERLCTARDAEGGVAVQCVQQAAEDAAVLIAWDGDASQSAVIGFSPVHAQSSFAQDETFLLLHMLWQCLVLLCSHR